MSFKYTSDNRLVFGMISSYTRNTNSGYLSKCASTKIAGIGTYAKTFHTGIGSLVDARFSMQLVEMLCHAPVYL